jgi:uncharacterized protein
MKFFDTQVHEEIGSYVYALIDPFNKKPFYVGKGNGNRVFDHATGAVQTDVETNKLNRIREIIARNETVQHIIVRHGMTDAESILVESVLIDFLRFNDLELTNIVLGHRSSIHGMMTVEEVERKYKAPPLEKLGNGFVVININASYGNAKATKSFYEATRGSWVMAEEKTKQTRFALAEYRGFIVEVFEIERWKKLGKRWQFEGHQANDEIRSTYINKRVLKRRGAANPIRYRLNQLEDK